MLKVNRRDVLKNSVVALAATGFTSARVSAATLPVEHSVIIKKLRFQPDMLEVHIGDTITWTNEDISPHTATAVAKDWDTGTLKRSQTKTVTVTAEMSGNYFCRFHPIMKAQLVIKD